MAGLILILGGVLAGMWAVYELAVLAEKLRQAAVLEEASEGLGKLPFQQWLKPWGIMIVVRMLVLTMVAVSWMWLGWNLSQRSK